MNAQQLAYFVALLRSGGVLACATETLQGLLANALDAEAVARVVTVKRRSSDPIAVLLPDLAALSLVSDQPLSPAARTLVDAYWPGPLTLVVPARAGLPHALAPHGTVGVRIPGPSPALELVRAFGGPLTATSCNPSGQPSARTEQEARGYFAAQLAGFVPGDAPGGAPSTVVDVSGPELRVLRRGAVTIAD